MAFDENDIVRVVYNMSVGADDIQNVYHIRLSGSGFPSYGNFLMYARTFLEEAYNNIADSIPVAVKFNSITAYNVTKDEYVGEIPSLLLTAGEVSPGAFMPRQACPLAVFPSSVMGSQGKKFLPPMDTVRLDQDGSPNATALAEIALVIADLLTGFGAGDWFARLGNWNPTLSRWALWTAGIVRDYFATQRRRYVGKGS